MRANETGAERKAFVSTSSRPASPHTPAKTYATLGTFSPGIVQADPGLTATIPVTTKTVTPLRLAQHYFCSRCGIYTHHRRRSNPNQFGVNVACLKGVSPFDFADVPVIDGVNHPADQGCGYEIVGHLRFIRTEDRSAAGPSV